MPMRNRLAASEQCVSRHLSVDDRQQVSNLDRVPHLHRDFLDRSILSRLHLHFHLHGLRDEEELARLDHVSFFHVDADHGPGNGCANLALLGRIRLAPLKPFPPSSRMPKPPPVLYATSIMPITRVTINLSRLLLMQTIPASRICSIFLWCNEEEVGSILSSGWTILHPLRLLRVPASHYQS